jgi:acetyl esterase/lipase
MKIRLDRCLVLLIAISLLPVALVTGCQGSASNESISYTKDVYTYKVVDGHEIQADVYRIPGDEIQPAIIWIHPGALIVGSREWLPSDQVEIYLAAGYTVVSIDYRLAPETKLAEIVADVEDAYAWVRAQGPKLFQIDPDRIGLVGHSAGAYLALTAVFRVTPSPRALVSFYGYGDISGAWLTEPSAHYVEHTAISKAEAFQAVGKGMISDTTGSSTEGRIQLYRYCRQQGTWPNEVSGHDPATERDWFVAYEPLRNVSPAYPPTLLLHGEADTDVPFQQSKLMADELEHHGVKHEFITNPRWGHMFDTADPDSGPVQSAFDEVLAFLDRHLAEGSAAAPAPTTRPTPTGDTAATAPVGEELHFRSGDFELVGDLRLPPGDGKHPAVIMVHGDGQATREGAVPFGPTIGILQRNGYAVFSWDKPGSGASTGEFDGEYTLTQRAAILAEAIEVLAEHPAIDSTRIGLWGISQAGWVMPLALELGDDVAFLIVLSGGGEDSIEQMVYQFGQRLLVAGTSPEEVALFEQYGSQALKTTLYTEYREAMEILLKIPGVEDTFGLEMAEEDEWRPWPRDIDAFIDPMDIIEHTTIPVPAFFGERDMDVDPVQGADAYEAALQTAGNQDYQIEVIPRVGHVFVHSPSYLGTLEAWIQHLLQ